MDTRTVDLAVPEPLHQPLHDLLQAMLANHDETFRALDRAFDFEGTLTPLHLPVWRLLHALVTVDPGIETENGITCLYWLAHIHGKTGDVTERERFLNEAAAVARKVGDGRLWWILQDLIKINLKRGDVKQAAALLLEAIPSMKADGVSNGYDLDDEAAAVLDALEGKSKARAIRAALPGLDGRMARRAVAVKGGVL